MKPERPSADAEFPPLTKRQVTELKRRMADSLDPRRFVMVSPLSPNFSLFYCPAEGVFAMNEIPDAALFKRKAEALAVARAMESRRRNGAGGLQVIAVKKAKRAVSILEQVKADGRAWKPRLRRK